MLSTHRLGDHFRKRANAVGRAFIGLSLRQIRKTPPRGAFCVSGGERGGGRTLRFDKFVWNDKDDRRSAPERAARRGEPHGWGSQSLTARQRDTGRRAPPRGAFCVSGGERCVDESSGDSAHPAPRPSGHWLRRCSLRHPRIKSGAGSASASDKFVWNDKDSRRLARSARREGIRPKDGLNPTHPSSWVRQVALFTP